MNFTKRMITLSTLAALLATSGCLLLEPDQASKHALRLEFVAHDGATGELARTTCGTPGALLSDPLVELSASARVLRFADDASEVGVEVVVRELEVGPYDEVSGSRTIEGDIDIPKGPQGSRDELLIELQAIPTTYGDLTGVFRPGVIESPTGLSANVDELRVGLRSGVQPGGVEVYPSTIVLSEPSVGSATRNFELFFQPETGDVAARYEVPTEDFFGDGEQRTIALTLAARFQPATIFSARVVLPDLLPQAEENLTEVIVLEPVNGSASIPVALDLELQGTLAAFFVDGASELREEATFVVERQGPLGCN